MLITNVDKSSNFRKAFESNLQKSKIVKIASGYIGSSEVSKYHDIFCDIARKGGTVQLIHGMGGAEGIRRNLYKNLSELDSHLKEENPENRVFIHKRHYHGKLYITEGAQKNVLLGSSNFSNSGFGRNLELNLNHEDEVLQKQANVFFDYLKDNSVPITNINLPDPNSTKHEIKKYRKFDPKIFENVPDVRCQIAITAGSNLNLFLSKGRLNSKTGIYTPRPFFEVELTLKATDLPNIRKFLPNSLGPIEFQAITDVNSTFEVKFKRKTANRYDKRTMHDIGIDFMSSPRIDLGHYIKGKLMREGLLKFGEPITEDTLIEYGKNTLDFYFIDEKQIYIKF